MVRENEYWLSPMFVYRENLEKESREKRDWNLAFWNWDGGENGFRFLAGEEENYGLQSLGLNKAHEIRLGERNWAWVCLSLGPPIAHPLARGRRVGGTDPDEWATWQQRCIWVTHNVMRTGNNNSHVTSRLANLANLWECFWLSLFNEILVSCDY